MDNQSISIYGLTIEHIHEYDTEGEQMVLNKGAWTEIFSIKRTIRPAIMSRGRLLMRRMLSFNKNSMELTFWGKIKETVEKGQCWQNVLWGSERSNESESAIDDFLFPKRLNLFKKLKNCVCNQYFTDTFFDYLITPPIWIAPRNQRRADKVSYINILYGKLYVLMRRTSIATYLVSQTCTENIQHSIERNQLKVLYKDFVRKL